VVVSLRLILIPPSSRDVNVLDGVYSAITLVLSLVSTLLPHRYLIQVLAGWLIYIQELTSRTEFVDLFIMRQEMYSLPLLS
jgi:hypothetical protein